MQNGVDRIDPPVPENEEITLQRISQERRLDPEGPKQQSAPVNNRPTATLIHPQPIVPPPLSQPVSQPIESIPLNSPHSTQSTLSSHSASSLAKKKKPKEPRFRTITDEFDIESIFRSVPLPNSDVEDTDYNDANTQKKQRTSSATSTDSVKRKVGRPRKLRTSDQQVHVSLNASPSVSSFVSPSPVALSASSGIKDSPMQVKDGSSTETPLKNKTPEEVAAARAEFIRKQEDAFRRLQLKQHLSQPVSALKKTAPANAVAEIASTDSKREDVAIHKNANVTELESVSKVQDEEAAREDARKMEERARKSAARTARNAQNRTDVIMIANKAIPYSAINNTDRSGRTPLFRVSGTGDVNAVTALIRAGADVNAKDNAGWSPIHEACIEGQLQTATLLISYGADVNALGFDNQTPLHDAVGANHYEVVELLLSHGASLTAVNKEGQTPMDDVEDETMLQILNLWKRMTAKVLEVDEHGITLLHQYAMKGELKHVKRVLKYGAEVDFACNAGWTPLHEAASRGYSSIVEELCRYGADLNPRSLASVSSSSNPLPLGKSGDVVPHGVTPLMDAASGCFVETVRLLLEFGADPEMSDSSGKLARDYVPEFTASENAKAAAEVMQLLNRPASSWTPVRKPDFVKSKIGTGGMMAHIRDQASAMLAKNEAAMGSKDPRSKITRKTSVSSDTSHSTNMNGSKGPSISATTAAAVGLGGPNSFSWGGLDPRDREGPFVSSREERKFNALLKTLGGGNGSGVEPGAGVIGGGPYSASAHAHFQAIAPAPLKAKTGPKPKKHSSDEAVAQRKHKKHKDESSGSDDEEDEDGGGRASKRVKRGRKSNRDSGDDSESGVEKEGRYKRLKKRSVSSSSSISRSDEDDDMDESAGEEVAGKGLKRSRAREVGGHSSDEDTVRALKKTADVNAQDATTAGLKFKKFPSSTSVGTAKEDAGSANRSPIRDKVASMPADEDSVKKETGKSVPASAPKGKEKGLLKSTSLSALGPTSKHSEARQHLPLADGLQRKQNTPIAPMPSHAPSTNSLATAPVSPHKKKPKKKNLFGISGYQRAGNEAQSSNPVVSVKADDDDNAATGTLSSNVSSTDLFKSEDIIIAPTIESKSALSIPVASTPETKTPIPQQQTPIPVSQPPTSKKTQQKASHRRYHCLPLYKIPLAPPQPSAAALTLPKKAFKMAPSAASTTTGTANTEATSQAGPKQFYFVDLQVAFYLKKKSGREVLDMFPSLSRRVATLAQKEALSASPVGEAVLKALMECRRRDAAAAAGNDGIPDDPIPPRWVKWYERDGKRALRMDDLDVQFLDAEEVLREIRGMRAAEQRRKLEGCQQEEDDDDVLLEIHELELAKFASAGAMSGLEQPPVFVASSGASVASSVVDAAGAKAAEQTGGNKAAMFHKFKKFGGKPIN
ncbi:hypothetical protein HDU77_009289 [Chytriomyces hyalinus]|nr:hypothetical protein HDU77_009289 [Chytriomyces hyalinus]